MPSCSTYVPPHPDHDEGAEPPRRPCAQNKLDARPGYGLNHDLRARHPRQPGLKIAECGLDGGRVREVEPHQAELGLVGDPRPRPLHGDGIAELRGGGGRRLGRRGGLARRHRHPGLAQEAEAPGLREHAGGRRLVAPVARRPWRVHGSLGRSGPLADRGQALAHAGQVRNAGGVEPRANLGVEAARRGVVGEDEARFCFGCQARAHRCHLQDHGGIRPHRRRWCPWPGGWNRRWDRARVSQGHSRTCPRSSRGPMASMGLRRRG